MSAKPKATVAAVVAHADKLRAQAEKLTRPDLPTHDPYARPYYPTTGGAKRDYQRRARELIAALPNGSTAERVAEVEAKAAQDTIAEMNWKAAHAERQRREEREQGARSHKNLQNRQKRAARDREAELAGLTPGQRIDRALAQLSTVATPASSTPEPPITGSKQHPTPSWPGDPAAAASRMVRETVAKVEDEVESARRRRVEHEREAA